MSSFLSGRWLPGYGDRLPDDLPGSGDYEARSGTGITRSGVNVCWQRNGWSP